SGFLESIASATLTFLAVVFTLTLVSLQLASSQLSPRVIRTFVRSGITRVAFGTLLAAFAYSVTALVLSHGRSGPATSRAVDVAAVLVAVSLVVFLRSVASMLELLQVVDVICAVARETKAAVAASWLPPPASRPAAAPARPGSPALLRLPDGGRSVLVPPPSPPPLPRPPPPGQPRAAAAPRRRPRTAAARVRPGARCR